VSDARLRELERRWKETGSVDDEASYLLERVRVGDLTRERLELAAYCGHQGARRAGNEHASASEPVDVLVTAGSDLVALWAELTMGQELQDVRSVTQMKPHLEAVMNAFKSWRQKPGGELAAAVKMAFRAMPFSAPPPDCEDQLVNAAFVDEKRLTIIAGDLVAISNQEAPLARLVASIEESRQAPLSVHAKGLLSHQALRGTSP